MRHDMLSDVLSALKNGDDVGKTETVTPASRMIKEVLLILQKYRYIGNFEYVDDGRGGKFRISLVGNINACGTVRPRYSVRLNEYEKYEHRFLPASGVGLLILSTPHGIVTHADAKEKKSGGRLLAYVY